MGVYDSLFVHSLMFSNPDKLRLRWRFDFASRPARYGQWSRMATRKEDMAAFRLAEGLVRASIEVQDVTNDEVQTATACDGHDYVNFKWIIAAYGHAQPFQRVIGLMLVTRDLETSVMTDGRVFQAPRDEADKRFHYATFGK